MKSKSVFSLITMFSHLVSKKAPKDFFNFKRHLSPSLQWRWMFKAFNITKVEGVNNDTVIVTFKTGYKLFYKVLELFHKNGFPISGYVCSRLVFAASIVAAGYVFKKNKKDGEVIVKDLFINYDAPIMYCSNSEVNVKVRINAVKETDRYRLFISEFEVGPDRNHHGFTTLYYCNPDLKNFSYLK